MFQNKFLKNPNKRVGALIKELRCDQDMSQHELVVQANNYLATLGTSRIPDKSAISRIESGKRELKYLESLALSHVLGVEQKHFWFQKKISYIEKVVEIRLAQLRRDTGNPNIERYDLYERLAA